MPPPLWLNSMAYLAQLSLPTQGWYVLSPQHRKTHYFYVSTWKEAQSVWGSMNQTQFLQRGHKFCMNIWHGKRNSKLSTFQIKQLRFKANLTIRHHIWWSLGEIYALIFNAHNVHVKCVSRDENQRCFIIKVNSIMSQILNDPCFLV